MREMREMRENTYDYEIALLGEVLAVEPALEFLVVEVVFVLVLLVEVFDVLLLLIFFGALHCE